MMNRSMLLISNVLLQVVITKDIEGFENITKANVGTSLKIKGTLIKSPAKG